MHVQIAAPPLGPLTRRRQRLERHCSHAGPPGVPRVLFDVRDFVFRAATEGDGELVERHGDSTAARTVEVTGLDRLALRHDQVVRVNPGIIRYVRPLPAVGDADPSGDGVPGVIDDLQTQVTVRLQISALDNLKWTLLARRRVDQPERRIPGALETNAMVRPPSTSGDLYSRSRHR